MIERGVITAAKVITADGPNVTFDDLSPSLVRYYALYWDNILLTDSGMFRINLSGELAELEAAGVVRKQRADISFQSSFSMDGSGMVSLHYLAMGLIADQMLQDNPGQWVLHQTGSELIVPENMSSELVTADVVLSNCLPVPKANIPLHKLLDFKLRRNDELLALRLTIDELYQEIVSSGDINRSMVTQVQRFETAISDLNAVAKQSWGEYVLANTKASLDMNFGSVTSGAALGAMVGAVSASPLSVAVGGVAGALAASLKIEVSLSKQLKSAEGKQMDLSYLVSMAEEEIAIER